MMRTQRQLQKLLVKTGRLKLKKNKKGYVFFGGFNEKDLIPDEKKHSNWKDKKEMKAYKKNKLEERKLCQDTKK